jgi:hypothetical protein
LAPLAEKRSVLQSIKELGRPRQTTFGLAPAAAETHELPLSQGRRVPEGMLVLNMFNYKDLQKLSILVERLEEATLVIQLNLDALRDVYEYYQLPIDFEGLEVDVRDHMKKSAASFRRKLRQIIRSLETRQTQLASLRKRLDNGKTLVREGCPVGKGWFSNYRFGCADIALQYENLLQLRSLQVSRIFAEHGHRSAINMESIARRTERETVSMHTVTVVTLLFLPATFLGVSPFLAPSSAPPRKMVGSLQTTDLLPKRRLPMGREARPCRRLVLPQRRFHTIHCHLRPYDVHDALWLVSDEHPDQVQGTEKTF